jgi:DNA-binding NtrC family response regulator
MQPRSKFPDFIPPTKVSYLDGKPQSLRLRRCKLVAPDEFGQAKEYTFDKEAVTIGAMEDNDVVVLEDTVSRYHAKIVQEENGYILVDNNSTNGTFVNKVRVREAFLRPGCVIHLGQAELRFQASDEEVPIVPATREQCGDIIGKHIKMREIFNIIEKIAPTGATVIIEGETGTGKDVVARSIHKISPRKDKPFVVFDCGAVPDNLIESELFGHEKGSFTGAIMSRQGVFEAAQGGTVFLDELGELNLDLQPKLLRVLEQREVKRVGSTKPIKVDVRVIAATNRDLWAEVKAGRFREDLFYRLSVVRLNLPPLRDRKEDIPLLVRHILKTHSANRDSRVRDISVESLMRLQGYAWPGNVRELLNTIERAVSFADGGTIEVRDLPDHIGGAAPPISARSTGSMAAPAASTPPPAQAFTRAPPPPDPTIGDIGTFKDAKEQWIASFERDYILAILRKNAMNISHAAKEADIDRKYFRKLMKKYQINVRTVGGDAADEADDDAEA